MTGTTQPAVFRTDKIQTEFVKRKKKISNSECTFSPTELSDWTWRWFLAFRNIGTIFSHIKKTNLIVFFVVRQYTFLLFSFFKSSHFIMRNYDLEYVRKREEEREVLFEIFSTRSTIFYCISSEKAIWAVQLSLAVAWTWTNQWDSRRTTADSTVNSIPWLSWENGDLNELLSTKSCCDSSLRTSVLHCMIHKY